LNPAIVVHGGAWDIPEDEHQAHTTGCLEAAKAGYKILTAGGPALEAVVAAVVVMEDNPAFDAGIGSHLNQAGNIQLDAGIMDGAALQMGAVAAIERVRNPIQVARLVLNSDYNMFVGVGATEWARQAGIPLIDPLELVVPREQERYEQRLHQGPPDLRQAFHESTGTVGAVAIDYRGNLAAATSTGGTLFKPAGRVGDSPLPGCGYYADNESAAVSSTGYGESVMRVQLARLAAQYANTLALAGAKSDLLYAKRAAQAAIDTLSNRVDGRAGLIMIDRLGRIGFAHNTPHLARAFMADGMAAPETGI
jgi:beta-aspartyl-peptidase (threonine type)